MNIPSEFDAIRPWEPEELTAAYDRLTSDRQFMSVVEQVYPDVPVDMLKKNCMHARQASTFRNRSAIRL